MKPIKPIHPYGPPVGKWTVHGTVADTIARERKRLKELAEAQKNVTVLRKVAK